MPRIEKFMTDMPHTISPYMPIKEAMDMMREHRIRHLPVQNSGKLLGLVTDRDIKLASSFKHPEEFKVEDIMTPKPYTVPPQTSAAQVVSHMAEHKYGCAIVQQENGKVVGIFTATDALRVLSEVMTDQFKPIY